MDPLAVAIDEAAQAIRQHWDRPAQVGIILGTGLGGFASQVAAEAVIGYERIPHFPRSTAVGHKGQLVCGTLCGLNVVTMEGRFHAYEGYSLAQITFPVRVMRALGIELLIVSNASGGLNPRYRAGDVVVIDDHINLMLQGPLIGLGDDIHGPRFADLREPYDEALVARAVEHARLANFTAHRGTYIALVGPNYETRAEYRFLRRIGGDMVGMSTVPEVIVAAQLGLRVLALSTVTNECKPDALDRTDGDSVVFAANSAEPRVRHIVLGTLRDEAERLGLTPAAAL